MKVAIFSDVHANLPALEAFHSAVRNRVDGYLCLGDIVNYGPWNDECLELIGGLPEIQVVEGNHEGLFLGREDLSQELPLVQAFTRASQKLFARMDLISHLPDSVNLGSFRAIHTLEGKTIYPDTKIDIKRSYMIGHSHHQFETMLGTHRLVNPGSVGQNRKFINVASFAVFDTDTEVVSFQEVAYDVDAVIAAMVRENYPDECVAYYKNKDRR